MRLQQRSRLADSVCGATRFTFCAWHARGAREKSHDSQHRRPNSRHRNGWRWSVLTSAGGWRRAAKLGGATACGSSGISNRGSCGCDCCSTTPADCLWGGGTVSGRNTLPAQRCGAGGGAYRASAGRVTFEDGLVLALGVFGVAAVVVVGAHLGERPVGGVRQAAPSLPLAHGLLQLLVARPDRLQVDGLHPPHTQSRSQKMMMVRRRKRDITW